eukprot:2073643-Amphidinium_carterae.1
MTSRTFRSCLQAQPWLLEYRSQGAAPVPMEVTQTTEELFNSKKPQATVAKALLSQAKYKSELEDRLKQEPLEEGFRDDRDSAEQSGVPTELDREQSGVPTRATVEEMEEPAFHDPEDFQPSLEEELRAQKMQALHERASQAVASASAGDYQEEADFDNDSDL